jgi:hypothetical protein
MSTIKHRRFRFRNVLLASLALLVVSTLLVGAAGVSAAAKRDRTRGKIACVELRAGGNRLDANLDDLVADGTLTEEQKAAILAEIEDGMGAAARVCSGMDFVRDGAVGDAVVELIGLDRAEIRIEWLDGQSLAEIAEAQGVDRQALIDTIAGAIDLKLDEAVEKGVITTERRAEIDAELPGRIEEAIDLRLSDVVDRMRDAHDNREDDSTPVSTTGLTTIA